MAFKPAPKQPTFFDLELPPEPVEPTEPTKPSSVAPVNKRPAASVRFTDRVRQPTIFEILPDEPSPDPPTPVPPPSSTPSPNTSPQFSSGEKSKARDILAAIRTLHSLEQASRNATPQERDLLAKFSGFGPVALSLFPNPVSGHYKDAGWQVLGYELQSLLTSDEYASAKRTTFNAFYTSPAVIEAMHEALTRLGLPENALLLEPGCGTGNFLKPGHRYIGVELDSISGRIARALHPDQDIRIEDFQKTKLPELDAVIGNVPFADVRLDYQGQKFALHDYFFAKSVDALTPEGIAALVTTHFTLDKQNASTREYLAERADFLGAIRLPSDAFQREGTAVVTDIVFLQKRASGESPRHVDPDWLVTRPVGIPAKVSGSGGERSHSEFDDVPPGFEGTVVPINGYFLNHPEMMLGTLSSKDSLYGSGYSLISNGDLAQQLRRAIENLPQLPQRDARPERIERRFVPPPLEKHIAEGSFFIAPNRIIHQVVDGNAQEVTYGGVLLRSDGTPNARRIAGLIGLRDHARRVLQSQNEGWPEEHRTEVRRELNWAYDSFVSRYGPINKTTITPSRDEGTIRRMPNMAKFREDPDAMLVMALEEYDEATGRANKAPILKKDVVGLTPPVTSVNSAEEGLLVSLDRSGRVDLPLIAELYGKPEQMVIEELGDLIFRDPETQVWQTADAYLSGNVRAKLVAAEKASDTRNVEALRAVQPEDVLPGEIDANLGAPWIPLNDIKAFACELFRVEENSIQIAHMARDAVWSVTGDFTAERSVAATSEFGTARANGLWLFDLGLNMKTPVIYDVVDHGDREERVVNAEDTLAAKEKQKLIKERFRNWVFQDPERTERLVRLYNDTYNNLRPRVFDGSHLAFPGMSQVMTLRPHQKAAIWRGMVGGNTLLAHCVGAGKTAVQAATAMKMKQAGLIRKPMIAVPNHMLEQFAREFLQLYPNAKLLVAGKEDFSRERRKYLTAKIASGDWDAVIVTHSSFERIGMSREYQEQFLREQIAEYDKLLCVRAEASNARRNIIKSIEKQKARREAKLKDLLAEDKKDDGLVFDELGVDHLFIDEAHYFKNLETPTKMERVAGIQADGSERAFDMFMKARFLHQKHPGHGMTFATGTPISNTLVELYTLQRYLDPDGLKSRGIEHFDAWAATFGEVVEAMEISPDGKSLRPRSRFAKFVNLPELQQMFRAFADVQTAEMLNLPRPKLETGKPIIVACPMSEDQHRLQDELVKRYERIRSQKVDPREDNALAITTAGRKLALDARLLSSTALSSPDSKLAEMVGEVVNRWEQTQNRRGTQMIFCDLGVSPTPWGFSVYDEIEKQLTEKGIPRDQVAVMGDADSDAKKQSLFEKVRQGLVRILIGSTSKMGTGTNVQKRLAAMHHLDAPWKPAEVEQRDGRILRQGNENDEVAVYRYVTEGSFDAYMWQALETKAKFISQVMTGQSGLRRAEDVGGQELSYAEVKAIASGNPAVLTLAEADAELQRLAVLRRNHGDEQYLARQKVRELPKTIQHLQKRLADLREDMNVIEAREDFTVGQKPGTETILAKTLNSLPERVDRTRLFPVGSYRGLSFGIQRDPNGAAEVYLEGKIRRMTRLSRESQGAKAVLNALNRLATTYEEVYETVRKERGLVQTQLSDYETRINIPFAEAAYFEELTLLRNQLKLCLAEKPVSNEAEGEQQPSATDVSDRIKALQASHRQHSFSASIRDQAKASMSVV